MFRKTPKEKQLGIFSHTSSLLSGKLRNYYDEPYSWHNIFRNQVTTRINETPFSKLYSNGMGAPNASVRVMVAMMIIKESQGWSDAQLFEHSRYNLLIRSALGLLNMDDAVPAESTYYLLRKHVVEHEKTTSENLIEKTFTDVTKEQAVEFEVSGKSIRMDSKLLGSNIAWYSRYELVHETLRLFYKKLKPSVDNLQIDKDIIGQLDAVLKEEGNKVVYRHNRDELKTRLQQLGILIDKVLQITELQHIAHYQTLCRVFKEQFQVDESLLVITRAKEEIATDSVQSPHDTDCHYRNKDGNQVKGYGINVTESCDKDQLHLISDVDVRPVSAADNGFLEEGISQSQEVFTGETQNVHADGAYHSLDNQAYCKGKEINLYLSAIQGAKGRFDLAPGINSELIVTDTETGEIIPATKLEAKETWRIKTTNGLRYFTQKQIDACLLRKHLKNLPTQITNVRNNVEASIFQLGYHYPNDKSRYRGLMKHKMWANIRCLWVNFVRILKYVKQNCPLAGEVCQRTTDNEKTGLKSFRLALNFASEVFIDLFILSSFNMFKKNFILANF